MKISKLVVIALFICAVVFTTSCGRTDSSNSGSYIHSLATQSVDSTYLTVDFDQIRQKNQTIIYTAWGKFVDNGQENKHLLRTQCCYITTDSSKKDDNIYTDLNIIFSLDGTFVHTKIEEILIVDISKVTVGCLLSVDIDKDGLDEVVLNYSCGTGSSSTKIYKIQDNKIIQKYDFDEFSLNLAQLLGYSVEYQSSKKYALVNTLTKFNYTFDIKEFYFDDLFDKNGRLIDDSCLHMQLINIYDCIVLVDKDAEKLAFKSNVILDNSYLCTVKTVLRFDDDWKIVVESSELA